MQCLLFPMLFASPIPDDARPIPNFGDDYLITPDGEVWSNKWAGPRRMKTFEGDSGPRVCLWRYGRRYSPDVATLIARTFGKREEPSRAADAELLAEILEEYAGDPDVLAWAESI